MVIAIIAAIFGAGFMTGYYVRSLVSRRRYDDAADGDVPGSVEFLKRSALPTLSR
jgi:hypothetical protein